MLETLNANSGSFKAQERLKLLQSPITNWLTDRSKEKSPDLVAEESRGRGALRLVFGVHNRITRFGNGKSQLDS